jgi:hypothetical protein
VVDPHCADRLFVPLGGERCLEDGEDGCADCGGDFVEAQTFVGEEELGVRPGAPFGGVDVVA